MMGLGKSRRCLRLSAISAEGEEKHTGTQKQLGVPEYPEGNKLLLLAVVVVVEKYQACVLHTNSFKEHEHSSVKSQLMLKNKCYCLGFQ